MGRVRGLFPALASGTAFFDSPGGTQTPEPVVAAIAAALRAPLSNRGLGTPAARNADAIVHAARAALADFTGVDPRGVVFGRSATALTFEFARTLSADWGPADEVVVTRLDHDANVRPWVLAAEARGATVRMADFDPATGELPPDAVTRHLSTRTRLVAVTAASNLIGTQPDVAAIAAAAHAAGALVWVDGVHHAAHGRLNLPGLGADFLVCSPYKFFGPHLGVLVAAPERLEPLRPAKLLPSSEVVPERFELGTLPYELLAGTTAAIDLLADLVPGGDDRSDRLTRSQAAVAVHERVLRDRLEAGLDRLGATRYSRAARRTSTVLFDLPGRPAAEVSTWLADRDVNAPTGSFYAIETSRHLGLGDGGAVRVGLAAYSTEEEVDRLLGALGALAAQPTGAA
ncbi:MAG: cysteine desulfurase-like protein [Actinomycetes bacterium]